MNARQPTLVGISLALFLANMPGRAQQAAKQGEGRSGAGAVGAAQGTERIATAPPQTIWPSPPLPDGPIILLTAEDDGALIKIEPVPAAVPPAAR